MTTVFDLWTPASHSSCVTLISFCEGLERLVMSEDRSRAPEVVPDAGQGAAVPPVDMPEPTRLTVGALDGQDAALQRKRSVVERTLG